MKTKICAVQFQIYSSYEKNIGRVEQFFKIANKKNCDIICFPEVFLTGQLNKKDYNPKIPVESKKIFSRLSKKYNLYSIMGTIIEKINNKFYNTMKKPISATIDQELINWIKKEVNDNKKYRNKSHLIETALEMLKSGKK